MFEMNEAGSGFQFCCFFNWLNCLMLKQNFGNSSGINLIVYNAGWVDSCMFEGISWIITFCVTGLKLKDRSWQWYLTEDGPVVEWHLSKKIPRNWHFYEGRSHVIQSIMFSLYWESIVSPVNHSTMIIPFVSKEVFLQSQFKSKLAWKFCIYHKTAVMSYLIY